MDSKLVIGKVEWYSNPPSFFFELVTVSGWSHNGSVSHFLL